MARPGSEELTQPTRARLLARVAELGRPATSEELADELGLHVNGVRRHLERLREAGLLERHRTKHGRGRPRDEWTVAPGAEAVMPSPRRYEDLARWLARAMPPAPSRLREVERTGREIGRELAPRSSARPAADFADTLAGLGFAPVLEAAPGDKLRCRLCNCPYADSVRENAELICTLHRGITEGILDQLAPGAKLTAWEPRDPGRAGCIAEASGTGWTPAEIEAARHAP